MHFARSPPAAAWSSSSGPPRGGLGALFRPRRRGPVDPHYASSGGAIVALEAEGFRAARLLAERDGLSFFEGVR